MTTIDLKALPDTLQKKHQSSTSGELIARLAIDERYKGKAFGELLLIDALRKLLAASHNSHTVCHSKAKKSSIAKPKKSRVIARPKAVAISRRLRTPLRDCRVAGLLAMTVFS